MSTRAGLIAASPMGGFDSGWNMLTHFARGPFVLGVDLLTVAAAIAYLAGIRSLAARGQHWSFWRTEAFMAGAIGMWISVGSGLAVYSMTDVTLHVVRHVILMMAVPALISLGRPLVLIRAAGNTSLLRALDGATRSRTVGALTHPAPVWFAYLASMYLMLADRPFFAYMMSHPTVQDTCTASMVVIGLLYWGTLVSSASSSRGPSYPARMISILANMPFEVLAGIWLRYQMRPITPMDSLADTRAAGEAFIVGATLVSSLWLIAVVAQWLSEALREEHDRTASSELDAGWTVPWWMENASPTSLVRVYAWSSSGKSRERVHGRRSRPDVGA